jgi:ELWxxDGT repeat protein
VFAIRHRSRAHRLALLFAVAALLLTSVPGGEAHADTDVPTALEVRAFGTNNVADDFVDLGGRAVFTVGLALWSSDGTDAGTVQLELGDNDRADLRHAVVLDGEAYFVARLGTSGSSNIWVTDGTPTGTRAVVDADELGTGVLRAMAVFGERVAFQAFVSAAGQDRIFLIDPTSDLGATRVGELRGNTSDTGQRLGVLGDELYVGTIDGADRHLHVIDQDGDFRSIWSATFAGSTTDAPTQMTTFGDRLLFRAAVNGAIDLWITDGTADGTSNVTTGLPMTPRPSPVVVGDRVLFFAQADNRTRLWSTDGTPAGTAQIGDAEFWDEAFDGGWGIGTNTIPPHLEAVDRLFFTSPSNEWWSTDGTPAGTSPVLLDGDDPTSTIVSSRFTVSTTATTRGAWIGSPDGLTVSDGTPAGTVAVEPAELGVSSLGTVDDGPWFSARLGTSLSQRLFRIGDPPAVGDVTGTITDASTSDPLAGATVTIGSRTTATAADGTYLLDGLAVGDRTVTASAPGYGSASSSVTVVADATATADLTLEPVAASTPDAPTGVDAVAADAAITVTWLVPDDDGGSPLTGYRVQVSGPGLTDPIEVEVSGTTTSALVGGLTNGATYEIRVVAVNEVGESAASDPAFATPQPAPVLVCDDVDPVAFADVAPGSVHAPAIGCLAAFEIVVGFPDGDYQPRTVLTRGQTASMVVRTLEERFVASSGTATSLPDDAIGSVHADAIAVLLDLGVMEGFEDGTFRPSEPITRGQLVSVMARATRAVGVDAEAGPTDLTDIDGSVHADNIRWAASVDIAVGFDDDTFRPSEDVVRAQAASLVARWLTWLTPGAVTPA